MRRTIHLFVVGIIAAIFLAGGCGKQELTRSKAKKLIESSKQFSPAIPSFKISKEGMEIGIREGMWEQSPGGILDLTDKGKTFISKFSPHYKGGIFAFAETPGRLIPENCDVTLSNPCERQVVEITGITDTERNTKLVNYNWGWKWVDIPDMIKQCLGGIEPRPSEGRAEFRLYDDGWRLEGLQL